MILKKLLKKLLIIAILACLSVSCSDNVTSTIPNAPVSLTLDLVGQDNVLNGSLSFKEYTAPRLATDRLGYGGILVINGFGDNLVNLFAYDLACPNEAQSNIKIKPASTGLKATCPSCGAVYNIANGGAPESGSEFWLRRYSVVAVSDTRYKVAN